MIDISGVIYYQIMIKLIKIDNIDMLLLMIVMIKNGIELWNVNSIK